LFLTQEGQQVMRGTRNVRLRLPPESRKPLGRGDASERKRSRSGTAAPSAPLAEGDEALFQALRSHRLALAREAGVAPYVIASDRSLRDLAAQRPRDLGQLLDVYGFGQTRAERYGAGFLALVAGFLRGG
jgi:ATP-dependent DNA helicase RecQ